MRLESEIQDLQKLQLSSLEDFLFAISSFKSVLSAKKADFILSALDVSVEEALVLARFDQETYTRQLLFRNQYLEAMILSWLPGQSSPLHNHKGSLCSVKVLAGELTEVLYERTSRGLFVPSSINKQSEGEVSSTYDEDVHQVANSTDNNLVTLHIYSPPQSNSERFPNDAALLNGAKAGKDVEF